VSNGSGSVLLDIPYNAGGPGLISSQPGQRCCPGHAFVDGFMSWADAHGVSYLGWAWVVYPQCTPDSFMLIADYATDSHLAGDRPA